MVDVYQICDDRCRKDRNVSPQDKKAGGLISVPELVLYRVRVAGGSQGGRVTLDVFAW